MIANNRKRMALPSSPTLATAVVVLLLSVSMLSLAQLAAREDAFASDVKLSPIQFAQTTTPIPAGKDNGPAQSDPGGARPTTPAPEPARPDADAQKAGVQPALPAAPAEKVGEPIKK